MRYTSHIICIFELTIRTLVFKDKKRELTILCMYRVPMYVSQNRKSDALM